MVRVNYRVVLRWCRNGVTVTRYLRRDGDSYEWHDTMWTAFDVAPTGYGGFVERI